MLAKSKFYSHCNNASDRHFSTLDADMALWEDLNLSLSKKFPRIHNFVTGMERGGGALVK